jgi:hypothetical protein
MDLTNRETLGVILEKLSSPFVGMMFVENAELVVEQTEAVVHRQQRVTRR